MFPVVISLCQNSKAKDIERKHTSQQLDPARKELEMSGVFY
jgi:hypothetical protein